MSSAMIPENIKMDLRSVLLAASGTPQSKIEKEYQDMVGQPLNLQVFGFTNVYEFLLALEGDVCRMEFQPKICDNLVYAVLDQSSFVSEHAKKNSAKGTGIRHKTPEEISRLGGPISKNKNKNNANNTNKNKSQTMRPQLTPQVLFQQLSGKALVVPTIGDWNNLNKLSLNSKGQFGLFVQNVKNLNETDLKDLFKEFNPCYVRLINDKKAAIITLKTYLIAFTAWIHSIDNPRLASFKVEPCVDRELKWLNTSHKILINGIPFGKIHMKALLKTLTRFVTANSLFMIETRVMGRQAVAYYQTKELASQYCKAPLSITDIHGEEHILHVSLVEDPQKQSFASINSQITRNAVPPQSLLKTPSYNTQQPLMQVELKGTLSRHPLQDERDSIKLKEERVPILFKNDEEATTKKFSDKRCGFPLDYTEAENMFQVTCKRSVRTSRNVSDNIQFYVTHFEDGCRFWILIFDQERNNFKKLDDLHKELDAVASRIQPPATKPKKGSRGAALYKDDNEEGPGMWYRCYVMDEGDEGSDTFSVFFVDFGNVDHVQIENFRNTYTEFWKLPPQAIPCKLYGVEVKRGLSCSHRDKSRQQLMENLSVHPRLRANVVKDADYSQPHVVELLNVRSDHGDPLNIDELCGFGLLYKIGDGEEVMEDVLDEYYEADEQRGEEVQDEYGDQTPRPSSSLFSYDPNQLVFGMVSEVHSMNLVYLLLGDFNNGVNVLETSLSKSDLVEKGNQALRKGEIALLYAEQSRRRVLVLEINTEKSKVKVLHVDYGKIEWVKTNQIYQLDPRLVNQPFQARPAALAGLKCKSEFAMTQFLKSFIRKLVRANIVRETDSGKLFVELFDANDCKSLNLDLIKHGLAEQRNLTNQDQLDETASVVSVPTNSSTTGNLEASTSSASFSSRTNSEIEAAMSVNDASARKDASVEEWLDSSVTVRKDEAISGYRPHTPPGLPPDIVSSNVIKDPVKLANGIRLDGRKILLGFGEDIDELSLDEENRLVMSDVDALRKKWMKEKETLEGVRASLRGLLLLSPAELKEKFKEKRKEKLRLLVEMKKIREQLEKVEMEYEKVVMETELLLASV